MHADSTFEIKKWDEVPYEASEGRSPLNRATVTMVFEGDITGDGIIEYVLDYSDPNSVKFLGYQYMNGTLGGKTGTYTLQINGSFADGKAQSDWEVVPGSAQGELKGLRGKGSGTAGSEMRLPFALDYDFEK